MAFVVLFYVVAGGAGAVLRYLVDSAVRAKWRKVPGLGTLVVNITGSFLLAFVMAGALPGFVGSLLGWALGGYTTFSAASVETVQLIQERRWLAAFGYSLGMLVASVLAAFAGFALAR